MENRAQNRPSSALYVYDRICSKESKKREIYSQYGVHRHSTEKKAGAGAQSSTRRSSPSGHRPRGDAYSAGAGRTMAGEIRKQGSSRARYDGSASRSGQAGTRANFKSARVNDSRQKSGAHAYTYRPERAEYGAEAVSDRPFKLILDRIVNLFESVEERGRRDEMLAKRQAIARKRFYEHRHAISTAVLLVLVALLFVFLVYKLFFVVSDISVNGAEAYTGERIIAVSGINTGDNLYSFSTADAESQITFYCPYIRTADISRTIPNTVSITVTEDTAMYVADIYGERLLLSAGLRILGVADGTNDRGLCELILPNVVYSVAGRVIEFEDAGDERYVRDVLSAISASSYSEKGEVDLIDLSDEYDITLNVAGKYIFRIGSEDECARKLLMAESTMAHQNFDKNTPAYIDLTNVGEASVRYDHKLSFD